MSRDPTSDHWAAGWFQGFHHAIGLIDDDRGHTAGRKHRSQQRHRGDWIMLLRSDTILHNFGGTINGTPDGWQPWGSLTPVQTSSGTIIFGRTLYGGSSDDGVIFTMNPDGSDYTIVHSFVGKKGDGQIFQIDTSGNNYQVLYSFTGPTSDGKDGLDNVFILNGFIYGMTKYGGSVATPGSTTGSSTYENGVIFSIPLPS